MRLAQNPSITILAAGLILSVSACGSLEQIAQGSHDLGRARQVGQDPQESPLQAAGALTQADAFATIARLEDARQTGGGYLQTLLRHKDAQIRARAATALGRLELADYGEHVTGALIATLDDEAPAVRATVAFALGLRADPAAGEALALAYAAEKDSEVRARIIEAASKTDDEKAKGVVLRALADPAEQVRLEALTGPHRWDLDAEDTAQVNRTLIEALPGSGELRWRGLFTLQRRAAPEALETFLQVLADKESAPLERVHAAKGLGRLELTEANAHRVANLLASAGRSDDWRVAYEAIAGLPRQALLPDWPVPGQTDDPFNAHVAQALAGTYARVDSLKLAAGFNRSLWDSALSNPDREIALQAAQLNAVAEIDPEGNVARVESRSTSEHYQLRAAAAEAASHLEEKHSLSLLLRLTRDAHPIVVQAAIDSLGKLKSTLARARLVRLINNKDNAIAAAAVAALSAPVDSLAYEAMETAMVDASGDIGPELRVAVLEKVLQARDAGQLQAVSDTQLAVLIRLAFKDPHPYVARLGRAELAKDGTSLPEREPQGGAVPALAPPPSGPNPWVEVETTCGTMTFELFPREAPNHVHSFLTLAGEGYYEGLTWHRVVPNFVIQGGCYRGDGWGGGTWRGQDDQLRAEITPRKYTRGSLGMPRGAYMESGGSQLFVTHRPTPHLDGRYTIFGELRSGGEVLDAIQVGDRILSVKRVEGR